MNLSLLLHPKPKFLFPKIGFPPPTRWRYSTSTKPGSDKISTDLRAQKSSAVESFVKKYMESHQGVFPSVSLVRNKVGGSWYTLKDLVLNLKETMRGNPSSADSASHGSSPNKREVSASESTVMNAVSGTSNISSSAIAISEKTLSEETKDEASISENARTCSDSSSNEPCRTECSVQSSTLIPAMNSYIAGIKLSQALSSDITVQCSSTNMLNSPGLGLATLAEPSCIVPTQEYGESSLRNVKTSTFADNVLHTSDSTKLVETKKELFQHEKLSKIFRDVSRDQKMKPKGVATEELGSTETAIHSETSITAFSDVPNSGSEIGERSGLSNQDSKSKGLAKLLAKHMDDKPAVNPKQAVKAIVDSLSRFETDSNTISPQLPLDQFILESPKILQEPRSNVTASAGYKTPQPDIQAESSASPSILHELGSDFLTKRKDHPQARHKIMTEKTYDFLNSNISKDSSSSSPKDADGKDSDISSLINCLKELPPTRQLHSVHGNANFTNNNRIRGRDLIGDVQSQGKLQQYDSRRKQTVLNDQPMVKKSEKEIVLEISSNVSHANSKIEDEESRDTAALSAFDNIKSTSSAKGPLSTSENDLNKASVASSVEHVWGQNKALLRFVPESIKESDVAAIFDNSDDITKIELCSVKQCKLKIAHVYFKTKDKLQEALKRNYWMVGHETITIEAASSSDSCKLPDKICIPNLIGDPDAPAVLLKNPTRTVMIKDLTDDMCSHHIREALLAFCKSNISGFFFGSSSSVAYVEFETEEGKDRALAKHSIVVQGKPLSIFRVDAPRTTVVRISKIQDTNTKKLVNLCKSFGKIKLVRHRCKHAIDIHFVISEWPNMLKILNRLNGMRVDGHKVQAQAAPVFPPEVILALWSHPEEKRQLKDFMHKSVQKLQESDAD